MRRLLEATDADLLFMGQKDYQQCMVVQWLIDNLKLPVRLITCPTLREPDGLAMSSRNLRLTENDRKKASMIYESLLNLKQSITPGNISVHTKKAVQFLTDAGFRVDYVEVAAAKSLQPVAHWNGSESLVALAAAFLGEVRLIDNMLLNP
jgi:pantoate--beta-alanine ligase